MDSLQRVLLDCNSAHIPCFFFFSKRPAPIAESHSYSIIHALARRLCLLTCWVSGVGLFLNLLFFFFFPALRQTR